MLRSKPIIALSTPRQVFSTLRTQSASSHRPPPPPSQTPPIPQIPLPSSPSRLNPPTPSPYSHNKYIQPYIHRFHLLSQRTGTPLPSLFFSFLILHEITAIIPVVGFYYLLQWFGLGVGVVDWIADVVGDGDGDRERAGGKADGVGGWREWVSGWYVEGEKRVERVGRKYGILGYEKAVKDGGDYHPEVEDFVQDAKHLVNSARSSGAAEKVADAISAYIIVKALAPVRLGISLAAAPAFARFAFNPIHRVFNQLRKRPA